jgi:phosphoglycolate phosphatase
MTPGTPELRRPKAILFDWDNTLVDTWPCIGRATNITLEAMGHKPWDEAELRRRVAGSLRDTFPTIYGDRWEEARDIFYKAFADVHLEMLVAAEGAEVFLRQAAMAGIYLGVVSNKTGKYLRAEAQHLGWSPLFGKLVGAQDAARDKPAVEPIHMALENSGVFPGADVWFVGDAPIDVTCGRAAGCVTVFVGSGGAGHDMAEVPDYFVSDCKALADLLRRCA